MTCSIRATRASRSLSFICTGSSWDGVLAQPAASTITRAMAVRRPMEWEHEWRIGGPRLPLLRGLIGRRQINNLDASVLRPGRLVVPGNRGTLIAVAHGGQLRFRGPLQQQCAAYGLRTALTQADV